MVRVETQAAVKAFSPSPITAPDTPITSSEVAQVDSHKAEMEVDVETSYKEKRDVLLEAADETMAHISGLTGFLGRGKESWPLHYPAQLAPSPPRESSPSMRRSLSQSVPQHTTLAASTSFTPSESSISEEPSSVRPLPTRGVTICRSTASPPSPQTSSSSDSHPLSVLDVDLKVGSHAPSSIAIAANSVGSKILTDLFVKRCHAAGNRMNQIRVRTADPTSRILVSGDVNAGKSTFVNAILRKPNLMPTDQQPLTEVFTEVVDARENGGKEEIHAIKVAATEAYDATRTETYDRFEVDELTDIVARSSEYSHVKVYIDDVSGGETENGDSLLRNDTVSISLIDGPGLNVDSVKSTAVFSRESQIDVVVFIVSAENHFTLSGREFLLEAAREKAYVFIVVNKWAGIRDKAKCTRIIGDQIRMLSPATWKERDELVHYVDSEGAWKTDDLTDSSTVDNVAFQHLERSLRSFVLRRREKSKLAPAKVYMENLLMDLWTMADYNYQAAQTEIDGATSKLETLRPAHEKLVKQRSQIEDALEHVEEMVIERVHAAAVRRAKRALESIAQGRVISPEFAAEHGLALAPVSGPGAPLALPTYPGIWHVAEWYNEVQDVLKRSLHAELCVAEDYARKETKQAVQHVMEEIPKQFLPEDALTKKERTFNDAAMYEKSRRKRLVRLGVVELPSDGVVGTGAVGLRTATKSRPHFEFSFVDLIDTESLLELPGRLAGNGKKRISNGDLLDPSSAMSMFSLSFGAVAMLGSRIAGVHNLVDSVTRTITFLGSKEMQRLLAPAAVIAFVGGSAYVVYNIPRSVPRNVGRRLVAEMEAQAHSSSPLSPRYQLDGQSFATHFGQQVSAESRKCIRYASFQTKEMHRMAEEEVAKEREGAEHDLARGEAGKVYFNELRKDVLDTRAKVVAVDLSG